MHQPYPTPPLSVIPPGHMLISESLFLKLLARAGMAEQDPLDEPAVVEADQEFEGEDLGVPKIRSSWKGVPGVNGVPYVPAGLKPVGRLREMIGGPRNGLEVGETPTVQEPQDKGQKP